MNSNEIRKAFLDYFEKQGHAVVPSSSLVPGNDATLLFTNAGMVQFKDVFLGSDKRSYSRATTAQRCVRAGGKHNDLENVGYTARHHTYFEMLGNFSFGDYFKREAIFYAWEFLTKVLGLPAEKLWVTVFKDDDETADIWLKEMKVSPDRFSRCGEKDNFWSMGDTGPCGPCTEIFYDHGPEIAGGPPGSPDEDGDRYIEIWNLVFMQFNRDKSGELTPLPKPSVDTGMGLERISAVVEHVHSNYEISTFQVLLDAISALNPSMDKSSPSLRVIADHIRACSFLISDGVLPSNEGRGYVLRRIIRRAVRHGHKLGLPSPFFHLLLEPLAQINAHVYPELTEQKALIAKILKQEEEQFGKTLAQGLNLLEQEIQNLKSKEIPGDVAFKLYDTYGFPIDLTADIARERNMSIDMPRFEICMQKQREQSQAQNQFSVDYSSSEKWSESSLYFGYDNDVVHGSITEIRVNNKTVDIIHTSGEGIIALDKTSFYAESGGQVGDIGFLKTSTGLFQVLDTQKSGDTILHIGKMLEGTLSVHEGVETLFDTEHRQSVRLNHTATHLLHAALKDILGSHVQQKGSLVNAHISRFDFSHFEAMTAKEIEQVETLVNQVIRHNIEVSTDIMSIDDAKKSGAMALFGEKYAESVRVLTVGDFSKELCGGTHVKRTGDIGLFKIIAEYGIASGVRRIEMVTGQFALNYINQRLASFSLASEKIRATADDFDDKLNQIIQESKNKDREITQLKQTIAHKESDSFVNDLKDINGVSTLIKEVNIETSALKAMIDSLRSKLPPTVIVLYNTMNDKLNVVASVDKSLLTKASKAPDFVRHLCGKGGGRDDLAQGGGDMPSDLSHKLASLTALITG